MLEEPRSVVAALARVVALVEPERLSGDEAASLLELAGEVERLGAGLRLLVAGRAVDSTRWQQQGHGSPATWVAALSRTSVGEARSTLETSAQLAGLPETMEAVRRGKLSAAQARAIADTAAGGAAGESELLEAAGVLSVAGLRQLCRQACAEAQQDPEHAASLHRRRSLRFWTDPDGLVRLAGSFTAEAGAELVAAVRSRAAYVADEAMAAGLEQEPQAAYDADALVALAAGDLRTATFSGNVGGRRRSATVVLHVSLEALRRGRLEPGELCEVPGLGPVPLAAAESLMGDASTLAVIGQGGEVQGCRDLGPTVPVDVQRALEARDPTCVVPGCAVSLSLETDFWQVPYGRHGPPALWNLARLCPFHHRLKTYEGFELAGGPGRWEWRAPP